jgi:Gas vesicle synthesis protein GvpL/GvpF
MQHTLDFLEQTPAQEGIGGTIRTVCHADIVAIVSPDKPCDLGKMRREDLAKLLLTHQRVIEQVMESSNTVIPFCLGTYASTEAEVIEILSKGSRLIHHLFSEIGDKIEMDVVVTYADFAAVIKDAGEEDEIKKYKAVLSGDPKGVSVDDRMKVGLLVKQALDCRRLEISCQIAEKLATVSCVQCTHENMDDQMVMNCAFLVKVAQRPQFEHALDELNAQFMEKLKFRCVGPLAPYSFYTLMLKRMQWPDIDAARQRIGLDSVTSAEEIKIAFRHSALAKHPDHSGQTEMAERNFDELIRARQTVLEYFQACEQTGSAAQLIFNEETVRQNSLLLKVRNGNEHG